MPVTPNQMMVCGTTRSSDFLFDGTTTALTSTRMLSVTSGAVALVSAANIGSNAITVEKRIGNKCDGEYWLPYNPCGNGQVTLNASQNPIPIVGDGEYRLTLSGGYGAVIVEVDSISTKDSGIDYASMMCKCCVPAPPAPAAVLPLHKINGGLAPASLGGGLTITPSGDDGYTVSPLTLTTVRMTDACGVEIAKFDALVTP